VNLEWNYRQSGQRAPDEVPRTRLLVRKYVLFIQQHQMGESD